MMNIFEIVGLMTIDGLDKTKEQLSGLEKNAERVQKGMKIVGAAFTAVGVAGLALVQSTKKMNAQLGVTALNLGISTKEIRNLALETTNVTFPLDEVTKSFDLLARAGVKDQEVLKNTATAFDTLGDAIGMPASEVTKKLIPTMKTFNLTADQVAGKTDAMTYLFRNTTVSLEDFNRMVGYVTPDLVKMGLTTEDMIAILADLEDQGYSGEVMTREFRKAVTLATKEQIPLNEALGISTEKIESYKGELQGATGITQEYADVANEQYTLMDNLKQKWSELTLSASGFLEPLEPVLSGMTALGPLMMALSTKTGMATLALAKQAILHPILTAQLIAHKIALFASAIAIKVVTAAQWLWNAAMTANPIGIIIIAIGALIAAGVLLWKNWDKVTKFFTAAWDKMKVVMNTAKNFLIGTWDTIRRKAIAIWNSIADFFIGTWDTIRGKTIGIWNGIRDFFIDIWNRIVGVFTEHWDKILAILFPAIGIPILIARNWDTIKDFFKQLWDRITNIFSDWWDNMKAFLAKMNPWELIKKAWEKLKDGISGILGKIFGHSIVEDWTADLHAYLGSQDFGLEGEKMFGSLREGMQGELDKIADMTEKATGKIITVPLEGMTPPEGIPTPSTMEVPMLPGKTGVESLAAYWDGVMADIAGLEAAFAAGEFTPFEKGGIAMRPMLARIAEQAPRVPEAMIPLSREALEKLGLGGPAVNNYFNIAEMHVEGVQDVDEFMEQVIERVRLRAGSHI